jgi:hypothetical protein
VNSETIRDRVRRGAEDRCEYCQLQQEYSEFAHHVEHIIARQHIASDSFDNLALACHFCNRKKGPNLAGIDPITGEITMLFHPRRDSWTDHFQWKGPLIEGLSAAGRATVGVLRLNYNKRMRLRMQLFEEGLLN